MTSVSALERAAAEMFPASESESRGDWSLRFDASLPNRRVNSAWDLGDPGCALDRAIDDVVAWYTARDRVPIVKTTPGSSADRVLADWTPQAPTEVLVADQVVSDRGAVDVWGTDRLREWCEAFAAVRRFSSDRAAGMAAALEQVTELGLAVARRDNLVVGVGVGCVVSGVVGLQNIAVDESWQRRGLGRQITAALVGWGAERGAGKAFLQVERDNVAALSLYRSMGFEPSHSYHYRVRPRP